MTQPNTPPSAAPSSYSPPTSTQTLKVAAAIITALAGTAGYMVVPMVVAALHQNHAQGLSEIWVGLVGSADPAGMFVGAAIALTPIVLARPRLSAFISLIASLACNAASIAIAQGDQIALLLGLRLIAGAASGVALAIGLAELSAAAKPDRNFAIFTLTQMLFGATVAWLGAAGANGLGVIYQCVFAVQVAGAAAALLLRRRSAAAKTSHAKVRVDFRLAAFTAAANALSAGGFLMLWANIHPLATAHGLSDGDIVKLIDLGFFGGCAGTLISMFGLERKHRRLTVIILFLIALAATLLIAAPLGALILALGVFLFQIAPAWAFFGFGAVSEADPSGRLPIIHILSVKAGFGLAPLAASILIHTGGLNLVLIGTFVTLLIATPLYQALLQRAESLKVSQTET